VIRARKRLYVNQSTKIEKLSTLFPLRTDQRTKTNLPAFPNVRLSSQMSPVDEAEKLEMNNLPYKSLVGQLLYICITARPDIATAVSEVGRFAHNPGKEHWQAALKIAEYLVHTKDYNLLFDGNIDKVQLHSYVDADWASDTDNRRSRTGFCLFLGKSIVAWNSKLQSSTALSSTEAEYMALVSCCKEMLWCRGLLQEIGFVQRDASVIYEDNKSCIALASSFKINQNSKHIDIRYHFIKDHVLVHKDIQLKHISTGDMIADLFTKALPYPSFSRHRNSLGVMKKFN
jgi:hypothetical protein